MSGIKNSGEAFFKVLQRQRECLDGLDELHQPVVFTSAMMMDDGKDLLCCKTCAPQPNLEHSRYGNSDLGWPCETRKLLDRLGVGK